MKKTVSAFALLWGLVGPLCAEEMISPAAETTELDSSKVDVQEKATVKTLFGEDGFAPVVEVWQLFESIQMTLSTLLEGEETSELDDSYNLIDAEWQKIARILEASGGLHDDSVVEPEIKTHVDTWVDLIESFVAGLKEEEELLDPIQKQISDLETLLKQKTTFARG